MSQGKPSTTKVTVSVDDDDDIIYVTCPYNAAANYMLKDDYEAEWDADLTCWVISAVLYSVSDVEASLRTYYSASQF